MNNDEVRKVRKLHQAFSYTSIQMHEAVARDPQNWNYVYGLAITQAAAGHDPHQALRQAQALDPGEPMILGASLRLRGHSPDRWREAVKSLQMPVPVQG